MKKLLLALMLLAAPALAEDAPPRPTLTPQQAQVLVLVLNNATLSIRGVDLPVYLDALRALANVGNEK